MKDFLEDFKDNWDNSYWWADHQWLMIAVSTLVAGGISIGVKYTELKMEQTMKDGD